MLLKREEEDGEKTVFIFQRCSVNDSLKVFCMTYCGHNSPVVPLLYDTVYLGSV